MDNETMERTPILEIAWKRYGIFDAAAVKRTGGFYRIRKIILWLSVIATAFAILSTYLQSIKANDLLQLLVKLFFIAVPIVASVVAAFATRYYSNGSWLIMRGAAEEIKKEIYLYRTTRNKATREVYLEKRLKEIQRNMYTGLNGEFSFEEYNGPIPKYYDAVKKKGDPGFNDMKGEDYFEFRLKNQLEWHNKKINMYQKQRREMVMLILGMGGLGAIIAAWGIGGIGILVALTASITTALIGWQELSNYDAIIGNYSKVVMELTFLYDHWMNLQPEQQRGDQNEFNNMVEQCEEVLWTQHKEYIRMQQEVVKETEKDVEDKAKLAEDLVDKAKETAKAAEQGMVDATRDAANQALDSGKDALVNEFNTTLGKLAEEASSDLVKQELEAMRNSVMQAVKSAAGNISSLTGSLTKIVDDYQGIDIDRNTTKEQLNQVLKRFPSSGDVKG